MALVNRAVPALYNGVSQQPATMRMPSQSAAQINGWSTVVDGLRKRPPFQNVAKISSADLSAAFFHVINRTSTQRYAVVVTNGNLQVYDFAGNAKTVNFPHGKAYLTASSPNVDFAMTSVADYTFVVNKTINVVMSAAGTDTTTQPTNYLGLNNKLNAADIANVVGNQFSGATRTQYKPNPTAGALKGSVQSFDFLPGNPAAKAGTPAPHEGDLWQIQGDAVSNFTIYYVQFTGGVWNETVAPNLVNSLDANTMPWALVHNANDTFDFVPFSWAPRRVGDETTNPNPSFVGRTINDVFFDQNRLGLLSGENVVHSAAGDFGNYYRLTVTQLLDNSVVDVGASETSITSMNFAVPFATGLMLFSDQEQFRLVTPIDGTFTPTTISLQVATRYICSQFVRPIMLGSDIYFISEDDSYAHLREYYVKLSFTGQIQTTADDVTSHVPSYIPKGVYLLAGSLQHDACFLATSAQPSRLYVYKFYWSSETEKAQSAWDYWDLGAGNSVLAAEGLDDFLWAVIKRADGTYLEKMSLAVGANVGLTDNNGNLYDLNLDRRCAVTGNFTGAPSNYTTFNLPYVPSVAEQANIRIILGASFGTPGSMLDPSTYIFPGGNQVRVPGDFHTGSVFIGYNYVFSNLFSEQFMLNQNNVAVLSGRLTLKNWTMYYVNAAFFSMQIDPYGIGSPLTVQFVPSDESAYSGMTVGSQALIIGSPSFRTGRAVFGVFGESKEVDITLIDDTPYPCSFFEAEWEAQYDNRGRTI